MTALLLALALVLPNPHLTPGLTRPLSTAQVCTTRWGRDARHVTLTMKRQVFAAYGIPWADHAQYEVDHLVSRELGGADAIPNLWPEPWTGEWNAHQKDRLENTLHRLVCADTISLSEAQSAIRGDWRIAYRPYVHP